MEPLSFTLCLGLAIGQLTFLLWNTDFVVEYASKLGLSAKVFAQEYEEWKIKNNFEHKYPMFIREKFNTFWSRLFGCPFCFSMFSSLMLSVLSLSFYAPLLGFAAAGIACFFYLSVKYLYDKSLS